MDVFSLTFSKKTREQEMESLHKCDLRHEREIIMTIDSLYNFHVLHLLFNEHNKITGRNRSLLVEIIRLLSCILVFIFLLGLFTIKTSHASLLINLLFCGSVFGILCMAFFPAVLKDYYEKEKSSLIDTVWQDQNKNPGEKIMPHIFTNIKEKNIIAEINSERIELNKRISVSNQNTPDIRNRRI